MSSIDMMTNSLLEIWNLVWTKPQTGQATKKGFAIYIIVLGHNKSSPFSSPGFLTRFCPFCLSSTELTLRRSLENPHVQ